MRSSKNKHQKSHVEEMLVAVTFKMLNLCTHIPDLIQLSCLSLSSFLCINDMSSHRCYVIQLNRCQSVELYYSITTEENII